MQQNLDASVASVKLRDKGRHGDRPRRGARLSTRKVASPLYEAVESKECNREFGGLGRRPMRIYRLSSLSVTSWILKVAGSRRGRFPVSEGMSGYSCGYVFFFLMQRNAARRSGEITVFLSTC